AVCLARRSCRNSTTSSTITPVTTSTMQTTAISTVTQATTSAHLQLRRSSRSVYGRAPGHAYYGSRGEDYGAPILPGRPGRARGPVRARGRGDGRRAPRGVPARAVAPGGAPGPAVRAGRGPDVLPADHGARDAR